MFLTIDRLCMESECPSTSHLEKSLAGNYRTCKGRMSCNSSLALNDLLTKQKGCELSCFMFCRPWRSLEGSLKHAMSRSGGRLWKAFCILVVSLAYRYTFTKQYFVQNKVNTFSCRVSRCIKFCWNNDFYENCYDRPAVPAAAINNWGIYAMYVLFFIKRIGPVV